LLFNLKLSVLAAINKAAHSISLSCMINAYVSDIMSSYKRFYNDDCGDSDRQTLKELQRTQEELTKAAREAERRAEEALKNQEKAQELERQLNAWQSEGRK
jgi:hypothetical protein